MTDNKLTELMTSASEHQIHSTEDVPVPAKKSKLTISPVYSPQTQIPLETLSAPTSKSLPTVDQVNSSELQVLPETLSASGKSLPTAVQVNPSEHQVRSEEMTVPTSKALSTVVQVNSSEAQCLPEELSASTSKSSSTGVQVSSSKSQVLTDAMQANSPEPQIPADKGSAPSSNSLTSFVRVNSSELQALSEEMSIPASKSLPTILPVVMAASPQPRNPAVTLSMPKILTEIMSTLVSHSLLSSSPAASTMSLTLPEKKSLASPAPPILAEMMSTSSQPLLELSQPNSQPDTASRYHVMSDMLSTAFCHSPLTKAASSVPQIMSDVMSSSFSQISAPVTSSSTQYLPEMTSAPPSHPLVTSSATQSTSEMLSVPPQSSRLRVISSTSQVISAPRVVSKVPSAPSQPPSLSVISPSTLTTMTSKSSNQSAPCSITAVASGPKAHTASLTVNKPLNFKLKISQDGGLRLTPLSTPAKSLGSNSDGQLFFIKYSSSGQPQLCMLFASEPNKLYLLQPSAGQQLNLKLNSTISKETAPANQLNSTSRESSYASQLRILKSSAGAATPSGMLRKIGTIPVTASASVTGAKWRAVKSLLTPSVDSQKSVTGADGHNAAVLKLLPVVGPVSQTAKSSVIRTTLVGPVSQTAKSSVIKTIVGPVTQTAKSNVIRTIVGPVRAKSNVIRTSSAGPVSQTSEDNVTWTPSAIHSQILVSSSPDSIKAQLPKVKRRRKQLIDGYVPVKDEGGKSEKIIFPKKKTRRQLTSQREEESEESEEVVFPDQALKPRATSLLVSAMMKWGRSPCKKVKAAKKRKLPRSRLADPRTTEDIKPTVTDEPDSDPYDFPFKIDTVFSLATDDIEQYSHIEDGQSEENPVVIDQFSSKHNHLSQEEMLDMCGSSFVVLERLSKRATEDKGNSETQLRCSEYCRKRTLNYLCMLKLIRCYPVKRSRIKLEHDAGSENKTIKKESLFESSKITQELRETLLKDALWELNPIVEEDLDVKPVLSQLEHDASNENKTIKKESLFESSNRLTLLKDALWESNPIVEEELDVKPVLSQLEHDASNENKTIKKESLFESSNRLTLLKDTLWESNPIVEEDLDVKPVLSQLEHDASNEKKTIKKESLFESSNRLTLLKDALWESNPIVEEELDVKPVLSQLEHDASNENKTIKKESLFESSNRLTLLKDALWESNPIVEEELDVKPVLSQLEHGASNENKTIKKESLFESSNRLTLLKDALWESNPIVEEDLDVKPVLSQHAWPPKVETYSDSEYNASPSIITWPGSEKMEVNGTGDFEYNASVPTPLSEALPASVPLSEALADQTADDLMPLTSIVPESNTAAVSGPTSPSTSLVRKESSISGVLCSHASGTVITADSPNCQAALETETAAVKERHITLAASNEHMTLAASKEDNEKDLVDERGPTVIFTTLSQCGNSTRLSQASSAALTLSQSPASPADWLGLAEGTAVSVDVSKPGPVFTSNSPLADSEQNIQLSTLAPSSTQTTSATPASSTKTSHVIARYVKRSEGGAANASDILSNITVNSSDAITAPVFPVSPVADPQIALITVTSSISATESTPVKSTGLTSKATTTLVQSTLKSLVSVAPALSVSSVISRGKTSLLKSVTTTNVTHANSVPNSIVTAATNHFSSERAGYAVLVNSQKSKSPYLVVMNNNSPPKSAFPDSVQIITPTSSSSSTESAGARSRTLTSLQGPVSNAVVTSNSVVIVSSSSLASLSGSALVSSRPVSVVPPRLAPKVKIVAAETGSGRQIKVMAAPSSESAKVLLPVSSSIKVLPVSPSLQDAALTGHTDMQALHAAGGSEVRQVKMMPYLASRGQRVQQAAKVIIKSPPNSPTWSHIKVQKPSQSQSESQSSSLVSLIRRPLFCSTTTSPTNKGQGTLANYSSGIDRPTVTTVSAVTAPMVSAVLSSCRESQPIPVKPPGAITVIVRPPLKVAVKSLLGNSPVKPVRDVTSAPCSYRKEQPIRILTATTSADLLAKESLVSSVTSTNVASFAQVPRDPWSASPLPSPAPVVPRVKSSRQVKAAKRKLALTDDSKPVSGSDDARSKRDSFQKLCSLPPGVVIKSEPVTFGYQDDATERISSELAFTASSDRSSITSTLTDDASTATCFSRSVDTPATYLTSATYPRPGATPATCLRASGISRGQYPDSDAVPVDLERGESTGVMEWESPNTDLDRAGPPTELECPKLDLPAVETGIASYDEPPVLTPVSPLLVQHADTWQIPVQQSGCARRVFSEITESSKEIAPSPSAKTAKSSSKRKRSKSKGRKSARSKSKIAKPKTAVGLETCPVSTPSVSGNLPLPVTPSAATASTSNQFPATPVASAENKVTSSSSVDRIRQLKDMLKKQNEELEMLRRQRMQNQQSFSFSAD